MLRFPRYHAQCRPLHIVLRGIDRTPVFRQDADYNYFKSTLLDDCARHGLAIHAYVLMENHLHLLATPQTPSTTRKTMQSASKRYLHYFNRRYERSGSLWEGTYLSTAIETDDSLIECMRYIELNPVRAGLVEHPAEYLWSSYRANAEAGRDILVTQHPLYRGLSADPIIRCRIYREIAARPLKDDALERIRRALHG